MCFFYCSKLLFSPKVGKVRKSERKKKIIIIDIFNRALFLIQHLLKLFISIAFSSHTASALSGALSSKKRAITPFNSTKCLSGISALKIFNNSACTLLSGGWTDETFISCYLCYHKFNNYHAYISIRILSEN